MQRVGFDGPAAPPGLLAGNQRGAEAREGIKDAGPEIGMHFEASPGQFHRDHRLRILVALHHRYFPHARIAPLAPLVLGQAPDELEGMGREGRHPGIFLVVIGLDIIPGEGRQEVVLRDGLVG